MRNMIQQFFVSMAAITIAILFLIVIAVSLSVKRGTYTVDEQGNKVYVPKLWTPPNSWEPGDGHPPGYDGVDLSKWRK